MNPTLAHCSQCYTSSNKDLQLFTHSCGAVFCQQCIGSGEKCRFCITNSAVTDLFNDSVGLFVFQSQRNSDFLSPIIAHRRYIAAIHAIEERRIKLQVLERENRVLRVKVSQLEEIIKKKSSLQPTFQQIDLSPSVQGNTNKK